MLSTTPLEDALVGLFPPGVRVAAAPLDTQPAFAHAEEAALVAGAVDKRQREVATGRRLAHALLEQLGVAEAPLLRGADRAPLWPTGVTGTITHSRELCVVAVADAREQRALGVDHEPATPLQPKLWRVVLRPDEKTWIESLPENQRGLTAKLVFSAKECLYKTIAAQLGEIIGFLEVELRLELEERTLVGGVEARSGRFTGVLVDPARAARVSGVLEGRALIRDEGLFTAMALSATS